MPIPSTNLFQLSIDKISITANATSSFEAEQAFKRLLYLADKNPLKFVRQHCKMYHLRVQIAIVGSSSGLTLQVGPRSAKTSDYRKEYNPSKHDAAGIKEIRQIIDHVTDIGFSRFFLTGKITRLDVALDFIGQSLETVIVRSKRQQVFGIFCDRHGNRGTAYLGKQQSNRTVCYSKTNKLTKTEFLRLERRLRPMRPGNELIDMTNPFECVDMIATAVLEPHLDGLIPYFYDSCYQRGVKQAVKFLKSKKQQKAILTAFANPSHTLLPPMNDVSASWSNLVRETLPCEVQNCWVCQYSLRAASDELRGRFKPLNLNHLLSGARRNRPFSSIGDFATAG